jgi:hypothetical protein
LTSASILSRTAAGGGADEAYMSISDTVQILSLLVIGLALAASLVQNRQLAKQTIEAARQSGFVGASLQQNAYRMLVDNANTSRTTFLLDHPHLLRWYLSSRGLDFRSHRVNQRILFAMVKLDGHEANYLSYTAGQLNEEMWSAWRGVLERDFSMTEFHLVWPNVKECYAGSFVNYVDETIMT